MTALNIVWQAKSFRDIVPPLKKLLRNRHSTYDVPASIDLVHYLTNDKRALGALLDDLAHAFHRPAFGHRGSPSIRIETVSHLLSLGEHTWPTDNNLSDIPTLLSFPSQVHLRRRHAQIPTVAMLTSGKDLSSHLCAFFLPVPLACIVHKALLGELFRKAVYWGVDWDWRGTAGPIIEETQQEMVPEGVTRMLEALERWGEGRREGVLPFTAVRMKCWRQCVQGGLEIPFDFES
ncbi:hypothetical protein J3R83DRAFT_249 [Lanmaoa asiatica]|nr:hypothetical protein J3R83DRAFT_249 [Lanmaoa asiatica]